MDQRTKPRNQNVLQYKIFLTCNIAQIGVHLSVLLTIFLTNTKTSVANDYHYAFNFLGTSPKNSDTVCEKKDKVNAFVE